MKIVGIDIGGSKCTVVLGESASTEIPKILTRYSWKTPANCEQALQSIERMVGKTLDRCGLSRLEVDAIGIACGGPLDSKQGIVFSPPNLPGWDNIHITERLEKRFDIPTLLQNDADACATAEWYFGAGRGTKNMIFLTFGTGLGAGLILNGAPYTGGCNMAGEIGHIRLSSIGPVGHGKAGSFEGFCSGGGIRQLGQLYLLEKIQQGKKPLLLRQVTLEKISAQLLAEAAEQNDPDAIAIYRICGRKLGEGLSIVIDLLNPERIIMGGIFTRCESLLREEMQKVIDRETLPLNNDTCQIVTSELGELIGDFSALCVGRSRILDKLPTVG